MTDIDVIAHPGGWLAGLTERVKAPTGDTESFDVTDAGVAALTADAEAAIDRVAADRHADLGPLRLHVAALARAAQLAVAHDRQPYPTADAYRRVCAALEQRKANLDTAQAKLASVFAVVADLQTQSTVDGVEPVHRQALGYAVERLRDVLFPGPGCRCHADYRAINAHKVGCPQDPRPLVRQFAQAISDPGSVVGFRRGPSWKPSHPAYAEQAESLATWGARAVLAVLGVGETEGADRG